MIRVCLVEDQTLVREGLRSLLDLIDDIEVVAEARDGEEAIRVIPEVQPDVVLLDIRMPRKNGLEVLAELKDKGLPPTLVLTTFDEDGLVLDAIRAGARGFLLKDVSLEQLASAIRALAAGKTLVQPAVTERMLRSLHRQQADSPDLQLAEPLTERETEILRLMAGGHTNREIGEGLHIAEGTVKNHISKILAKLGVRDRTRAVLKGLDLGFI
ncbi:MAG: response regulator transcription factor [Acidobacteria bacterium]|nr:MAG: response regulator transcription factor [Acidobacteriota bacterium]